MRGDLKELVMIDGNARLMTLEQWILNSIARNYVAELPESPPVGFWNDVARRCMEVIQESVDRAKRLREP